MKKIILAMTVLTVVAGIQTAKAGDREWAVTGKILTGLVAASVITHAVQASQPCPPMYYPAPRYSYYARPAPRVVYAPPVYCAPPPVVVYRAPVYCAPAPVYCAPRPVVSFRFDYDGGHHRSHHGRW